MNKRKGLRQLSLLVVIMLLIMSFGFSACKRKDASEIILDSSKRYFSVFQNLCSVMSITNSLWGETDEMIPGNLTFIDFDATPSELYLLCSDPNSAFVAVLDSNGSIREICPVALPKNAAPAYLFSGTDGFAYIFYETQGSGPWDIGLGGVTLLPATGETAPIDLSSLSTPAICDISFNGIDTFAFLTEDTLFLTNTAGQIIEKTTVPEYGTYFQSVNFVEKTRIQTLYLDSNSNLFLQTLSILPIKTERQDQLIGFVGTEVYSAQLIASRQPDSDRVLLETESAIYCYNKQINVFSKYLDKTLHDFFPVTSVFHNEGDQILVIGITNISDLDLSDAESVRQNYGLFSVSFSEDDRPALTVRVGLCTQSPEIVNHYIRLFTKTHPEYIFDFIDYNAPQAKDSAATVKPIDALYVDLLSDHPPDILFIDPSEYERIASANALTDMNQLIAQDDSFDAAVFLDNVWAAGETDGTRCYISPFFGLNGMYAQNYLSDTFYGKTLGEFENNLRSMSETPHILQRNSPQEIAELFISLQMNEIILSGTEGQCLNTDLLRSIVSFARNFGTPNNYESLSLQEQFAEGKILFSEKKLRSYLAFLYDMEHYFGSDVRYISSPGVSKSAPIIFSNLLISIPTASGQPDEAWTLVKYILSPEIQDRFDDIDYSIGCMPIRTSSFDLMLEKNYSDYLKGMTPPVSDLQISDGTVDQMLPGLGINQADPYIQTPDGPLGPPVPQNPLPQKETLEAFRTLVCSAQNFQTHNDRAARIIFEELSLVFTGQKSTDEAVLVIENRLQAFFDEGK